MTSLERVLSIFASLIAIFTFAASIHFGFAERGGSDAEFFSITLPNIRVGVTDNIVFLYFVFLVLCMIAATVFGLAIQFMGRFEIGWFAILIFVYTYFLLSLFLIDWVFFHFNIPDLEYSLSDGLGQAFNQNAPRWTAVKSIVVQAVLLFSAVYQFSKVETDNVRKEFDWIERTFNKEAKQKLERTEIAKACTFFFIPVMSVLAVLTY